MRVAGALEALGWDTGWVDAFAPFATGGNRPARVVAVHRETSIVRDGSGDHPAGVSGVFRFAATGQADFPAVGDWVAVAADGVIAAVLPRRSVFRRVASDGTRRGTSVDGEQIMASNVDVALLVAGLDNDFNLRRIERYLAVAESSAITPIIVLNKSDLADDLDGRLAAIEAIAPGVATIAVSARTGAGLDELRGHLRPGRTAAILGSSGVGKSTLVNALLGEDRQATAAVRGSDSRGRHTTTHRELFELPNGALLVDTPGIRALEVLGADEGVEAAFDDVIELATACRFSDCRHHGEPGCAVREALDDGRLTEERLASHRKLERELARSAEEIDSRARAANRRPVKSIETSAKERDRLAQAAARQRAGARRRDTITVTDDTDRLEIPEPPSIEGLRARHFRDVSDYDRLADLMGAAHAFDDIPWLPTAENLQVELDAVDSLDPALDLIFVEVDGHVVASSRVERTLRDGIATYEVSGTVHPEFRRRGLGTSLLAWNLRRATERATSETPGTPVVVHGFAEEQETGNLALLVGAGFEPVRHFFLMRRDRLDDIPDAPLPDGVELRPVTQDQHRAIFDAENEAFRDHWGSHEWGDDRFRATFAKSELDTSLWVVAWDGDQVAGVVENWIWPQENEKLGVRRGWLERISVRRPWRRRGLARAITAASLIRVRAAGMTQAMLGVDSANPTGALGLYEGLGFEVHRRSAAYRRTLGLED